LTALATPSPSTSIHRDRTNASNPAAASQEQKGRVPPQEIHIYTWW
jgi:hypothetical protein